MERLPLATRAPHTIHSTRLFWPLVVRRLEFPSLPLKATPISSWYSLPISLADSRALTSSGGRPSSFPRPHLKKKVRVHSIPVSSPLRSSERQAINCCPASPNVSILRAHKIDTTSATIALNTNGTLWSAPATSTHRPQANSDNANANNCLNAGSDDVNTRKTQK
jgi:hypothetical protein